MKDTNPHLTPLFGAPPSPLRHRARILLSAAAIPGAPAFNSEQQLCWERYVEGESCHWGLEHGDELDAHYGA